MFYHWIIVSLSQLHVMTCCAVLWIFSWGLSSRLFSYRHACIVNYISISMNLSMLSFTALWCIDWFIVPILPLLGRINLPRSLPLRARLTLALIIWLDIILTDVKFRTECTIEPRLINDNYFWLMCYLGYASNTVNYLFLVTGSVQGSGRHTWPDSAF